MLWLGGALESHGIIDRICCQTDMAKTLLSQMTLKTEEFLFSQNMLDPAALSFAYYAFNDGFGFITPGDVFIWDHTSSMPIQSPANDSTRIKAFAYFNKYQHYFLGL